MSKYWAAIFAASILLMTPLVLISRGYHSEPQIFPAINSGAQSSEWTAGIIEKRKPAQQIAVLRGIRAGRHGSFDRVVFEFRRGAVVPGYHIEYIDRPVRQCGSGNTVRVEGDGWLSVRLTPAQAHTDAGAPTLRYRERRVRFPVLRELQSTCDFEGQVEWVLGVTSPNRYRVMELTNPARLVVDIRH